MTDSFPLAAVLEQAERTHALASRLRDKDHFTGHLERQVLQAVEDLMRVARDLATTDAAQITPNETRRLSEVIDLTVNDLEQFISSHQALTAKRLERNQHLVVRIYGLRQVLESLRRGDTPNLPRLDQ